MNALLEARFDVAQDVHARRFHDELVILDLCRGEYFALDDVGSTVWESLGRGATLAETVAVLATLYDADVARLEGDVLRLVDELTKRNLLVPSAR
jgi:hypothetical protein